MTGDRLRFLGSVCVVVALLGVGVYLKINGHGEWNWLFVALAVLTPFLFGVSTDPNAGLHSDGEHEDEDSNPRLSQSPTRPSQPNQSTPR